MSIYAVLLYFADRYTRPVFSKTILDHCLDFIHPSDSNPSASPVKKVPLYFIVIPYVLSISLFNWIASYKVPTIALLEVRSRQHLPKGRGLQRSPGLKLGGLLSVSPLRLPAGIPLHGLRVFCALICSQRIITDFIYQNVFRSMICFYPMAVSAAYAMTTSLHALWTLQIPFRADPDVFNHRVYWTRRDLISVAAAHGAIIGALHLLSEEPFIHNTIIGRSFWHMLHLFALVLLEYPRQLTELAGGPLDKEVVIASPNRPGNLMLRECAMDPQVGTLATFQDAVDWIMEMSHLLPLVVILVQRFLVERSCGFLVQFALDQLTETAVQ